MADSEYRLYGYILDRLKEMGWNTNPPNRGGQVYTQSEVSKDEGLKQAFGLLRPENVVLVKPGEYWVVEAKSAVADLQEAVTEAKSRAELINANDDLSCRIVTGIAGSPDTTHYIETYCRVENRWERLCINNRESTGFISPEQVAKILSSGSASLSEYEIDDVLFMSKTEQINTILHQGGVNKRNRAGVLACLLLALANDPEMQVSSNPSTLINDINTRAAEMMRKHGKQAFFGEISITLPTTQTNHHKHWNALVKTIEMLRGLNIASAIDSGRDVLGQFYEQFLKYANDASELGIVFTPRHITSFAAELVNVRLNDVVFDPACGTGGFLVAALDKVRRDGGDIDHFKTGNLHGIEQDQMIAALAIVNMIFRGDGSSNILEGDCFKTEIATQTDKVLMNPPFAHESEFEWKFVDRALESMKQGGILFAVVPTTVMSSAGNLRGELTWRTQMLKRHTLLGVIKMPRDLFRPQVEKGTYGILIKAHRRHDRNHDPVIWAVFKDGAHRSKLIPDSQKDSGNMGQLSSAIRNFVASSTLPEYQPMQIDHGPIGTDENEHIDLSPENYIGRAPDRGRFNIVEVGRAMEDAKRLLRPDHRVDAEEVDDCGSFLLLDFVDEFERGQSGRAKNLPDGDLPLISTAEEGNGISEMVDGNAVSKTYLPGRLTVSANGYSCRAFYHDYRFAANPMCSCFRSNRSTATQNSQCFFAPQSTVKAGDTTTTGNFRLNS